MEDLWMFLILMNYGFFGYTVQAANCSLVLWSKSAAVCHIDLDKLEMFMEA